MMNERSKVEQDVRLALEAQDLQRAATRALEAYGREILSFLFARLHDVNDGQEAFSMFVEDFWKSLPSFAAVLTATLLVREARCREQRPAASSSFRSL